MLAAGLADTATLAFIAPRTIYSRTPRPQLTTVCSRTRRAAPIPFIPLTLEHAFAALAAAGLPTHAAALHSRYTDWWLLDGELELAMTAQRQMRQCRTSRQCRTRRLPPRSSQDPPRADGSSGLGTRSALERPPDATRDDRHVTTRAGGTLPPARAHFGPHPHGRRLARGTDLPAPAHPRVLPVHAPRKCLKLKRPGLFGSTHKRAHPRPASCKLSPATTTCISLDGGRRPSRRLSADRRRCAHGVGLRPKRRATRNDANCGGQGRSSNGDGSRRGPTGPGQVHQPRSIGPG